MIMLFIYLDHCAVERSVRYIGIYVYCMSDLRAKFAGDRYSSLLRGSQIFRGVKHGSYPSPPSLPRPDIDDGNDDDVAWTRIQNSKTQNAV